MSESEEERRLRKEKKREAARRAAAKEAVQTGTEMPDTKSLATRVRKETEEERRIRKEKKRAQREAASKAQGEGGGTATTAAPATAAATVTFIEHDEAKSPAARHHHHGSRDDSKTATTAAAEALEAPSSSKKKSKSADDNADLLNAIEAENNAVAARTASRGSLTSAATPTPAKPNSTNNNNGNGEPRKETKEERAARKNAEREERRRLRHAAAAAGEGAGGGNDVLSTDAGAAGGERKSATISSTAGPSPTTGFDPSELQRQAYRAQFQKDFARATALRRLLDFDSSGGVVLDLAPQTAYDLYIREFGQSGREQASVQAPPEEERLDVATQAERGKLRTRGAQAPEDLGLCPEEEAERQFLQLRRNALQRSGKTASRTGGSGGGAGEDNNEEGDNTTTNDENNGLNDGCGLQSGAKRNARAVDASLLERFLTSTLPLMSAVLDENNAAVAGTKLPATAAASADSGAAALASEGNAKLKGATAFSSSYTTFCWRATRNRPLVQVMLSPSNTQQLVALHGPRDESGPSHMLDSYMSVLLLWNVHNTTTPERVLVSFSTVTSVCVSPSSPYLIYGGTEDGNVCVWSLREPDRLHLAAGRFEKIVFHLPSYSTSWQADGHNAPVRQVRVSGYNAKTPLRREEQHEQLVSMDERGVVCFWVVTDKENSGKGAQLIDNDYGQHPYTSVSLHLTTGTGGAAAVYDSIGDGTADSTVSYAAAVASSFDFSPLDATQYVLTAPHGVVRRSRFGGIAVPSLYSPSQANDYRSPSVSATQKAVVAVPCCVQYSVLDPRWFVVGYEDGTLRPYLHNEATPKLTVEVGAHPIISVRCSGTTPWVVWALDESGEVHVIDFAHYSRQTPRFSHSLTQPDTGVCTCMDVSAKDEKADLRVLVAGFEKGMVQLHTLDPTKLRIANAERDEKWI